MFISFNALAIALPDSAVLISPIAHQVGAYMDKTTAFVTRHKVVSVDIEESGPVPVNASNLTKPLAQCKVAYRLFIWHSGSPQWHGVLDAADAWKSS